MATEELKILITAEVQDAINKVKAVKNNLNDINKNSGVTNLKSSFSESAEGAAQLTEQLESIKSMNFAQLVANFAKLGSEFKRYKEDMAEYTQWAKEAQDFLNPESWIYKGDKSFMDWEGEKAAMKDFNIHMGEANNYLTSAKNRAGGLFATISSGAGAAAVAIGAVVAAVAALVGAIRNALNVSQRLRTDFFDARKVGLSTAAYQEWSYVLGQVGVEADALSDFIKSLSAAQNDLRDGSEAMTQAFKDLGFNIDEVVNMGQEELFVETIKRLQQLEDQVKKTSIAYRIFGEDDAAKVANLMSLSNQEMERMIRNYYLLGGAASDSAIEKSLALQSAVSSMKVAWQGLANTLGEAVMPILTTVVKWITVAIAAVNMFLRALFGFDIVASSSKSMNKASASVGGYSSAVKDATAAAKELKRTTMGFDELNIVSDPNKDAGGGSADMGSIGGGGAGFEMPELSGLTEDLGLEKMAAFFEKWKGVIQTVIPIAMVVAGLVGGIACLASGNIIGGIALLAMAGIGIAIGAGNGTWEKMFGGIWKSAQNAGKKFKKVWDDISKWWEKFWPKVKKVATDTWDKLSTFFKDCWEGIKRTAKTVWDAISNFFKTCWNGIKNTATTVFNAVVKFFSDTWNKIKTGATTAWNAIKTFLSNTWNTIKTTATTVWNAIAKFFSDTWNSIKTTATTAWNNIKTMLDTTWNNIKTSATNIWNAIKKFFNDTWENIKTTAINSWNNIKTNLEQAWESIKTKANELCENLKQFFKDAWDKIKATWDVVKQYFQDIWDKIKSSASSLTENVKSFFINAWSSIKSTWDTVKGYFQGIWDSIKSTASSMLDSVKGFFSSAWTSIKNTWSSVSSWFGDVWSGIKGKFSDVVSYFGDKFGSAVSTIKQKWSDIKDWFAQKWEAVKSVFTSAGQSIGSSITNALKNSFNNFMSNAVGKINNFIDRLNSAITLINKIPGVNIGTIGHLNVPQLATGGIVTDSILANIGERGKEAVLPLENNTSWMDILADRIAARSGPTRVVLQVDGRELGWATIENINSITKQTGGLQLTLV